MNRWLIWLPFIAFAGLLGLVATELSQPADRTVRSALVGKPLPAFALPPALPDKPGLASAMFGQGRPRLLNVFASWCVPCAAESPQLLALKRAGVEIDAIAVRDTPDAVRQFLARYGDPYARIGDDKVSAAQLALGSAGVPETFVIDGRGRMVMQHVGEVRPEHMSAILEAVGKAQ